MLFIPIKINNYMYYSKVTAFTLTKLQGSWAMCPNIWLKYSKTLRYINWQLIEYFTYVYNFFFFKNVSLNKSLKSACTHALIIYVITYITLLFFLRTSMKCM